MRRPTHDQRPLLDPWFAWQELPDAVRQDAFDLLVALYLETIDDPERIPENDD